MVFEYIRLVASKAKRNKSILLAALIFTVLGPFMNSSMAPDLYFLTWSYDNITCYYLYKDDALRPIDDTFAPPPTSIHFHETSCKGWLNSRQACAIESAARAHPNWQINVFFTGPVSEEMFASGSIQTLKKFKNIQFLRLYFKEYAKGTPLESLVNDGALNRTRWRISHTSDFLRYLTLYKWGGVYLDLDVVVAKSFDNLAPNWAARESEELIAAGALSFSYDSLGRLVAEATLRDLKENYRGDIWSHNGPGVITRVLYKLCNANTVSEMSASTCQGFGVYGPELFYPVLWKYAYFYFLDMELPVNHPYSYHVWNKITSSFVVGKDTAYARLAQKYCPTIYYAYGDDFGI
ncbi:lactosylceramide 4-alpha-galactosyltransferase-like [Anticarsia gemmatalis]|uniref:lactosylceramide 4-alpha-galactosyltransferase-like n=1 Tax=Anticarsia gemmatalis TaxID=129554 RepID=UPI003F75B2D9